MPRSADRPPRHILIYGPPAAGKLTVGRALADRYGLRLLDNHASVDPALRRFDFGTTELAGLVERLRTELLGTAARSGLDVVSTLVFAHPVDRGGLDRLVAASERGGLRSRSSSFVLSDRCSKRRVVSPERIGTQKICDVDRLRRLLDRYDLVTPINEGDLSIDNSDLPPSEAACYIGSAIGLHEG